MISRRCCYCNRSDKECELRPYGPEGKDVCFHCGTSTPERNSASRDAYLKQLSACGTVATIDTSEQVGPRAPISESEPVS